MTTQQQSKRSFLVQIARGFGLVFVLASVLFAALFASLSPVVRESATVQAAVVQAQSLRAVAQENSKEFICRLNSGEITFTATLIEEGECEPYAVPSAIGLDDQGVVFADNSDIIHSVALADVDGDGDLDIATSGYSFDENPSGAYKGLAGPFPSSLRIYTNQAGLFSKTVEITELSGLLGPTEIAWGDIDNDGDLDLASATLRDDFVYIMEGGQISYTILLTDSMQEEDNGHSEKRSNSVAWGDIDGDGKLELVVGNYGRAKYSDSVTTTTPILDPLSGFVRFYSFDRISPTATITVATISTLSLSPPVTNVAWVTDLAWADYDTDDDLDLLVGLAVDESSKDRPLQFQVYKNTGGTGNLGLSANSTSITEFHSVSDTGFLKTNNKSLVAPADIDLDGKTDIVLGRTPRYISFAYNASPLCTVNAFDAPYVNSVPTLHSLAWGDVDGDGDLDLAAGFQDAPDRVYLNQMGCINPDPVWVSEFDADDPKYGTYSLAWGDMDNDGDLDLVAGGYPIGKIYYNESFSFKRTEFPFYSKTRSESIGDYKPLGYVTLGDIDNDDDLDVARNVYSQPVEILLNQHGKFDTSATITVGDPITNYSKLMFGYINDDNFVDLYVTGQLEENSKIYLNNQGRTYTADSSNIWNVRHLVDGSGVGDIDNDERLELVRTAGHEFYFYSFASTNPVTLPLPGNTPRIAELGDLDNDGDLDIATTNIDTDSKILNQIYIYETNLAQFKDKSNPFGVSTQPIQTIDTNATLRGIAWGDMNGDGYLDLAVATNSYDQVYLNQNGKLQPTPIWTSFKNDTTARLAWGDVDGDGDLDLATGNTARIAGSITIYRVYRNDRGMLHPDPAWESEPVPDSTSIAWGDLDNDGIAELVTPGAYYKLNRPIQQPLTKGFPDETDPRIAVTIDRFSSPITKTATITALAIANSHAMPFVRDNPTIPITFTLFHPLSQTFDRVQVSYSLNGGGQWFAATGTFNHLQLTSSPFPTRTADNTHTFEWNVIESNIFGQYEDVVIRIEAYPSVPITREGVTKFYTNSVPTIATVPYVASQTYPFRLKGTQVRVVDEYGVGVKDAIVYRIPAGQGMGGNPLGQQGIPYHTDTGGYLQGRGTIDIGDQLLALAPQPLPTSTAITNNMAWAKDLTETINLYYTNGEVTASGVNALISSTQSTTVTQLGLQILQVSSKNPLLLFNLSLSLEWDASTDPNQVYLNQLKSDLFRASEHLYDITNGQVALGSIVVLQNGEGWASTDIVVQATNRLRPLAVQGGIVLTTISDEISSTKVITYDMGQVRMGSVWNRFGTPIDYFGSDWALTLAHELSHYLFFQDDTYMGLDENNLLIPITDCDGSFMGDMYDPSGENTEFVPAEKWIPSCEETLAHKSLARSEWDTIKKFYPMLHASNSITENAGPVQMPFALTEIDVLDPLTLTNALPDRIIYLDYRNSEVSSTSGRAYLIRDDKYIFELGSPVGGQNRLLLRGGQQGGQGGQGDNLCVIDEERDQYGCEEISLQDERLEMQSIGLTTTIQVRPISATELQIIVTGLQSATGAVTATIFPELGEAITPTNPITDVHGSYTWTYSFTYPILGGHIRLWSNGPTDALESIVSFSIGGNPGKGPALQWGHPLQRQRGKGPALQWGHPLGRGRWPALQWGHPGMRGGRVLNRAGNAPVISNDGQMIFFVEDTSQFAEGDLYGVNAVSRFPVTLPTDSKVVGFGYQLIASSNTAQMPNGSISIQYLGTDTLSQGITEQDEGNLHIYFFNENTSPSRIEGCKISTYYNLISAEGQGAGTYLLLWEPNSSDGSACKKVEQD